MLLIVTVYFNKALVVDKKALTAKAFSFIVNLIEGKTNELVLYAENLGAIKNSASVIVNTVGSGRIINIGDNPNFRGFWLGGTKLMMNAIFFGKIIDGTSGRVE